MAKQDFYEILGVSKAADADELKRAYRKLAMQFHPDRNPGDKTAEQKFKEISEAYDVLKDEQKRAAYDRFGHAAFENGGGGRGGRLRAVRLRAAASPTSSTRCSASSWAAARRRPGGPARGGDLRYNLEITLEEAFTRQADDDPRRRPRSPARPATAAAPSRARSPVTCPTCQRPRPGARAAGLLHDRAHLPDLPAAPARSSRSRAGPAAARAACGKEKTLSVNIPPGVEDGTRIRLAGEGEAGVRGAPPGDLYIFLARRAAPRSSSATAPTSTAGCRSRSPPRRSAARSRCRPSTAAAPRVTVPAGTQIGPPVPPARQGHDGAALAGARRHVHPGRWSRRRST